MVPVDAGTELSFQCEAGHDLSVGRLCALGSSALRIALMDLLETWVSDLARVKSSAQEASRAGQGRVAAAYAHWIPRMERRIRAMEEGLRSGLRPVEADGEQEMPSRRADPIRKTLSLPGG